MAMLARMRGLLAACLGAGMLLVLAASRPQAQGIPPSERLSGFDQMGPESQAMQRNDLANPGMLFVREGARLWNEAPDGSNKACASCHGDAAISMAGVAARYPAIDAASGEPIDLTGRIQQCRSLRQLGPAFAPESRPLLALSSYVGRQSRGFPIQPPADPRLAAPRERGKALFEARIGQLNLACAQCHDENWGRKLGGSTIPQAHPTGYPIYRLEWQALGSLQRRLRNCMIGVRAEPFAYGAPELIELELFLKERAAGLFIETPAVRP